MPSFELVTRIAAPPGRVFDASLDVDVHTASMADSGERVVGGVSAGGMRLGDTVTWRARHFGVWWRMTSAITAYDRPDFFVDEQRRGPFRRWRHEHHFAAADATDDAPGDGTGNGGGTVMRDVVEFASPLGVLGRAVDALALRRYMVKLIAERNAHIKALLEAEARH
ncbi:MAG: SRPBCC family protein [Streptomycetaceae bacterium]|nr:SRPBCC family protein [Streptomycetaceae bacterium]